ncbi:MAG: methyltransferase domain-containing protein, partial [Proteobacteria bacterium]|nr:methyltransferase domain-containing protein [Pseudomonadota bacterium]
TWKEAEAAGARCLLQRRIGYGGALRDGLQAARGDFVFTMDSDLSHPPELMRELWKEREVADVVIGSRFVSGGSSAAPRLRHLLSVILNTVFSTILSAPIKDSSSGYRLYRRVVLKPELYRPENFNVLQEILIRAFVDGWRVKEVPLRYEERVHGESHVSLVKFAVSYVPTLARLWLLRNSVEAADYEHRSYDSRHWLQRRWNRRRVQLIRELLGQGGATVVDLGCGSSRLTSTSPNTIALDIRQDKLRFLSATNSRRLQADLVELPLRTASVDAAIVSQSLEYVPELTKALREVNRVLKPGGVAVFSVMDSRRLGWRLLGVLYRLLPNVKKGPRKYHQLSRSLFVDQIAAHGFRALKYRYIFGSELILKAQKVE